MVKGGGREGGGEDGGGEVGGEGGEVKGVGALSDGEWTGTSEKQT